MVLGFYFFIFTFTAGSAPPFYLCSGKMLWTYMAQKRGLRDRWCQLAFLCLQCVSCLDCQSHIPNSQNWVPSISGISKCFGSRVVLRHKTIWRTRDGGGVYLQWELLFGRIGLDIFAWSLGSFSLLPSASSFSSFLRLAWYGFPTTTTTAFCFPQVSVISFPLHHSTSNFFPSFPSFLMDLPPSPLRALSGTYFIGSRAEERRDSPHRTRFYFLLGRLDAAYGLEFGHHCFTLNMA